MKNITLWGIWIVLFLAGTSYFIGNMVIGEDKSDFIIGEATSGHFQIEMACETCHTSAFGGEEVLQNACTQCHEQELEDAHDSHPKSKFTNPRNANLLNIIDARYCISCHTEHQKENTHAMGVTVPDDYCFHCHQEIGEERESHKDLAYNSCATAGCHNYHDNRALYEKFLIANAGQAPVLEHWQQQEYPPKSSLFIPKKPALAIEDANAPPAFENKKITQQWHQDNHAKAGVNCDGCHQNTNNNEWIEKPNQTQCANCHAQESQSFTQGKHGMRLSDALSHSLTAVSPKDSQLPFKTQALHATQGCNACHSAHDFNTKKAAVSACLECHNDEHSNNFLSSAHGKLWQQSQNMESFQSVSCATCHMPREHAKINGKDVLIVQHNQNNNLKPNEKMIRPVCMQCHGLEFAINALADKELIKNNFSGKPTSNIPSVDWALKREKQE